MHQHPQRVSPHERSHTHRTSKFQQFHGYRIRPPKCGLLKWLPKFTCRSVDPRGCNNGTTGASQLSAHVSVMTTKPEVAGEESFLSMPHNIWHNICFAVSRSWIFLNISILLNMRVNSNFNIWPMYSNYDINTWMLLLLYYNYWMLYWLQVRQRLRIGDEHLGKWSKASMSKRKNLKVKRVEGDSLWLLLVSIEELVLLEPKVCHFNHLWYAGSGILSTPCAMWTEDPASILLSCICWHVASQPVDGDCTSAGGGCRIGRSCSEKCSG